MFHNHQTSLDRIEQHFRVFHPFYADGWQELPLTERLAAQHIPGASMAIIEGGEIIWAGAYGVRCQGDPDLITPETCFQAASISKPIAALTALSLVAEGRLTLDANVQDFLISWRIPAKAGWQPRVTLRQLLSHSGGVTVHGFLGYPERATVPSLRQILNGEPPVNSPAIQVDTLPGLHFRYSGGGYMIVQQLIEDLTGQPFWQAAWQRVLEPAGMMHSTYLDPLPVDWHARAAVGHRNNGDPLSGNWHRYPESAAAGLWTTPTDLARLIVLLEATLRGEIGRLIHPDLLIEMLTPQIALRGLGLDGDEGLGFFLTGEPDDLYYGHGGSNEGYRNQIIVRKGRGQAAIVMTNSDSGDALTDEWINNVALEFGWDSFVDVPFLPMAAPPASSALLEFVGDYTAGGWHFQIRHSDTGLTLDIPGQPTLVLCPRDVDRFYISQLNASLQFQRENGCITALAFRQNGEDLIAERTGSMNL